VKAQRVPKNDQKHRLNASTNPGWVLGTRTFGVSIDRLSKKVVIRPVISPNNNPVLIIVLNKLFLLYEEVSGDLSTVMASFSNLVPAPYFPYFKIHHLAA